MYSKIGSAATFGGYAYMGEVEAHLESTTPKFFIVGLAEGAVKESFRRVLAAIKNSDFKFPRNRITVNLAPADIK
ncbi:MAG: magnesium chelatase domain-containing protein, partial [Bacteroidota bacterium]